MPAFDALNKMSPASSPALLTFAAEVRAGLSKSGQRELPSIYLYDEIGTALFEAITLLPEYGLTRADERLMRRYAPDILERLAPPVAVAELGSGTGRKTRWVLEALARREPVSYFPIDISGAALVKCRQELSGLGAVSIVGFEKPYLDGLADVARMRRKGQTLLVLFLGSTIGNFERPAAAEFLREIRKCLRPGDAMLLGVHTGAAGALDCSLADSLPLLVDRFVRFGDVGNDADLRGCRQVIGAHHTVRVDDVQRRSRQACQFDSRVNGDVSARRTIGSDNDLLVHRFSPAASSHGGFRVARDTTAGRKEMSPERQRRESL